MNARAISPGTLECGMQRCLPMADYLAINALSSTRLDWLATSPMHYQYKLANPDEAETEATERGTALHSLVLEPYQFVDRYVLEPDPYAVAPENAKPRATKAYKDAVAALETTGRIVLRRDQMKAVTDMRDAIRAHPHADRLLDRCPDREVTLIWDRDGRACRARVDVLGKGIAGDIKTTRALKDFSPWTITRMNYHLQAAWICDGLRRLGHEVEHFLFLAVESTAPYDVGVFVMERATLDVGLRQCEHLVDRLQECEEINYWPGMFPEVEPAQISDAAVSLITED